jgi:major membrane immunogen (membrane-anchored lipoprotein)
LKRKGILLIVVLLSLILLVGCGGGGLSDKAQIGNVIESWENAYRNENETQLKSCVDPDGNITVILEYKNDSTLDSTNVHDTRSYRQKYFSSLTI